MSTSCAGTAYRGNRNSRQSEAGGFDFQATWLLPLEDVAQGEAGLLVEPGSVDELSDALRRLLADSELRTSLGHAGLERVRSMFTWDAVADRCIAEYGL